MKWPELAKALILARGTIDPGTTGILKEAILRDDAIERQEVDFLIALKKEATATSAEFDRLLFDVVKRVVLVDGVISDREAEWMESYLFKDRVLVPDSAIRFLQELKASAKQTGPKFEALLAQWQPGTR